MKVKHKIIKYSKKATTSDDMIGSLISKAADEFHKETKEEIIKSSFNGCESPEVLIQIKPLLNSDGSMSEGTQREIYEMLTDEKFIQCAINYYIANGQVVVQSTKNNNTQANPKVSRVKTRDEIVGELEVKKVINVLRSCISSKRTFEKLRERGELKNLNVKKHLSNDVVAKLCTAIFKKYNSKSKVKDIKNEHIVKYFNYLPRK